MITTTKVLIVSKTSNHIYQVEKISGQDVHLTNLTTGQQGTLNKDQLQSLYISLNLTKANENPYFAQLITNLSLSYDKATEATDN